MLLILSRICLVAFNRTESELPNDKAGSLYHAENRLSHTLSDPLTKKIFNIPLVSSFKKELPNYVYQDIYPLVFVKHNLYNRGLRARGLKKIPAGAHYKFAQV